jgi:tRNA-specific 2-thiouridylase
MKTVFVGLSGGVDSAVSAYLLKRQGYKVVGAFIKGWEPDFLPCTGVRDRLEAMRVAAHLDIPFVTYDLEKEYKAGVVDYFVNEYRRGKTPNPDVMCNRVIKFGAFWEKAKADGADFIATGHYAVKQVLGDRFQFAVSEDKEKDQTYFLWTLGQEDLEHSLFPVGGLQKEEVRRLALEANLPNASRADSQGLCFLGHVDMHAFLKRYIPSEKGQVLDESGDIIGEHDGAWFYTLGQRMALNMKVRQYVVAKDIGKNSLTVSPSLAPEKPQRSFKISGTNWITGTEGKNMLGRFRYRQPLMPIRLKGGTVSFEKSQMIASGQSLVFYSADGKICLGGAVIE